MREGEALYKAIVANPHEDTPRLAYADCLDENQPHKGPTPAARPPARAVVTRAPGAADGRTGPNPGGRITPRPVPSTEQRRGRFHRPRRRHGGVGAAGRRGGGGVARPRRRGVATRAEPPRPAPLLRPDRRGGG